MSPLGIVLSFGLAAVGWEIFARSGMLPPAITPSVLAIGAAIGRMALDGSLFVHIAYTMFRIVVGLGLALVVGVPIGMLMGRFRRVEGFVLPLVSVLSPIPSLAWVPLFILWFGLGNAASIALVLYAATFPVILNTDVMLAGLAMIGIVGLALEKLVFERLERYTVVRWGMLTR